jgi:hypothetical protein
MDCVITAPLEVSPNAVRRTFCDYVLPGYPCW